MGTQIGAHLFSGLEEKAVTEEISIREPRHACAEHVAREHDTKGLIFGRHMGSDNPSHTVIYSFPLFLW